MLTVSVPEIQGAVANQSFAWVIFINDLDEEAGMGW